MDINSIVDRICEAIQEQKKLQKEAYRLYENIKIEYEQMFALLQLDNEILGLHKAFLRMQIPKLSGYIQALCNVTMEISNHVFEETNYFANFLGYKHIVKSNDGKITVTALYYSAKFIIILCSTCDILCEEIKQVQSLGILTHITEFQNLAKKILAVFKNFENISSKKLLKKFTGKLMSEVLHVYILFSKICNTINNENDADSEYSYVSINSRDATPLSIAENCKRSRPSSSLPLKPQYQRVIFPNPIVSNTAAWFLHQRTLVAIFASPNGFEMRLKVMELILIALSNPEIRFKNELIDTIYECYARNINK